MKRLFLFLATLLLAGLNSACDGIFHNIYDEPKPETHSEYGFIKVNEADKSGIIYVDARTYDRWVYIDFKNKKIDTANILMNEEEPSRWDFALHRYDVKTCGGSACETGFHTLEELRAAGDVSFSNFEADVNDSVTVDMSGMVDGIILYAPSPRNPILSKWMKVDTSVMPPIYTQKKNVYILQMSDGSRAALLFTNYMNSASIKGFITIYYLYPY